jgi:hypothetical protein
MQEAELLPPEHSIRRPLKQIVLPNLRVTSTLRNEVLEGRLHGYKNKFKRVKQTDEKRVWVS